MQCRLRFHPPVLA